jgi:hypothetical protein
MIIIYSEILIAYIKIDVRVCSNIAKLNLILSQNNKQLQKKLIGNLTDI